MNLSHKEMAKHVRSRLSQSEIPSRVRMSTSCGTKSIQVITPSYDFRWTPEQLEIIARIARVNRLTLSRGMPITEQHFSQMTGITQIEFVYQSRDSRHDDN